MYSKNLTISNARLALSREPLSALTVCAHATARKLTFQKNQECFGSEEEQDAVGQTQVRCAPKKCQHARRNLRLSGVSCAHGLVLQVRTRSIIA